MSSVHNYAMFLLEMCYVSVNSLLSDSVNFHFETVLESCFAVIQFRRFPRSVPSLNSQVFRVFFELSVKQIRRAEARLNHRAETRVIDVAVYLHAVAEEVFTSNLPAFSFFPCFLLSRIWKNIFICSERSARRILCRVIVVAFQINIFISSLLKFKSHD